jgi:hypothetical protein
MKRFHVEHAPVEELPANLRRAFEQPETVGVDQLQGRISASCAALRAFCPSMRI